MSQSSSEACSCAVTPYLIVEDAARAIAFYRTAFGAEETVRLTDAGGKVAHAELRFGDSVVMLADEHPAMGARGPGAHGGSPVSLRLEVDDADQAFSRALAAGASELLPVRDQFYGDRSGSVIDPSGHHWTIAAHLEDVELEELRRRFAQAQRGAALAASAAAGGAG